MVKIKRIAMAFVFLLSQVSMANTSVAKGKADVFDTLPLSAMLLTEAEIKNLKREDKIVYMKALVYLGQVIETAQGNSFDYEVPSKYEAKKTGMNESTNKNVFAMYWNLLVTKSEAIIGGLLKATEWVGTKLGAKAASTALRTAEATKSVTGGMSGMVIRDYAPKLAAAEKAGDAVKVAKLEKELAARGIDPEKVRVFMKTPDLKSIKASIEASLKDVRGLEQQREVARAAGNAADVKKLDIQIIKAKAEITRAEKEFYIQGGKRSQLDSIYIASNTTTGRMLRSNAAEAIVIAAIPTGGYYAGKSLGLWGNAQVKLEGAGGKKVRDTLSSPEANKDPGKIIREAGYSCIYGGRPSTFVNGEKGVLCKMPDDGQSKTCNVNDGKYLCPNYGFRPVGSTEEKEICIDLEPRRDITSNCVGAFESFVVEAGEVVAKGKDENAVVEYNEKIRQLLTTLEGDYMTDKDEKHHSFGYYCANSKKAQKSECNAITAFINTLKDRPEIKKAIEERAVASADGAASAAPPTMPPVESKDASKKPPK